MPKKTDLLAEALRIQAFRRRPCSVCGTIIIPSDRTTRANIAARIIYCSKHCKQAAWIAQHPPNPRRNREACKAWYDALSPKEKKARIAAIAVARRRRRAREKKSAGK